jgi:hypothetical protein
MGSQALAQTQAVPDRAGLRADLEATRAAFHALVDAAAGTTWRTQSPGSAWTAGEVLVHLTWALEYLPEEVARARRGKGMFNMPKWIADPGSFWIIRRQARKSDPQSLHRRYDAAMDAVLAALETVPDSDWGLGARFYGHGFYTVAGLFATPAEHLAEHTAGMQAADRHAADRHAT